MMKATMVQRAVEGLTLLVARILNTIVVLVKKTHISTTSASLPSVPSCWSSSSSEEEEDDDNGYGLSWRLAVEANNVGPWRTVPTRCYRHVQSYIMGGQYQNDVQLIADQILSYALHIPLSSDGLDAWVFDVDDTCISNINYYKAQGFGCDPFDSGKFKEWIMKGSCPAIPSILGVFKKLIERGFKVFLLTGRDQATLGHITILNLHSQGFIGYHRLILRRGEYKGESASKYKSEKRKEIEAEGYRIWGNVGDQWSDLQGYSQGKRSFKLPNPMYFIR
ncbi:acid phosphatase 1 [Neltuma alba]|uniref:acid phosphatase 1 n=1 Tax=Neltuma alba TaxID=207710 RepID=UPI0010A4C76A|nr:acid phosphatase 1-like [Prosopis alba]